MDRRYLLGSLGAAIAGIAGAVRSSRLWAQESATPAASPAASPAATPVAIVTVVLMDANQRRLGIATITEGPNGPVTVNLDVDAGMLAPGPYGLSLHETGICQPAADVPFASAGEMIAAGEAGRIGKLTVEQAETAVFESTVEGIAFGDLRDRDGTALVVHAGDDEQARVGCGVIFPPPEAATAAAGTPMGATPEAATPGAGTPGAGTAVTIDMVDIAFEPDELTIPADTDVTVRLPNLGQTVHNFNIDGKNNPSDPDIHSGDVPPGEETTVTLNLSAGAWYYYCSIPGHEAAGMFGTAHAE
jgi:Cu-Zn family superoxide dismutase